MSITITDVKIRKITSEERMRAIVSIVINDVLAIHDIKVIEGPEKVFVAMPSRKTNEGEFRDVVHPINKETREMIEATILQQYNEFLSTLEVPVAV